MKNKKLIYMAALAAMMSLTACNDFLETAPADGKSVETIFADESEMKSLLTQVYSKMTTSGLYGSTLIYGLNTNTDVEMSGFSSDIPNANGSDIGCYEAKATWTTLKNVWNDLYNAINQCNDFIAKAEKSPLFSTTITADGPTETQQMYGEAKTLRAMLYLDLVRTWGDVVFTMTPTSVYDDFYNMGTTDRNTILSTLIDDLKTVEPYMKYATDIDEGVERASRSYCQALIGQLAMYRAGYALRPSKETALGYAMTRADDYADYYKLADEYFKKVIDSKKHSLTSSFAKLWEDECNWTAAKNGEVIFEVPELKGTTGSLGYRVGVTITAGSHEYGSSKNYVNFPATYLYSFDPADQRRGETVSLVKYDAKLNQQVDLLNSGKNITGFSVAKWSKLKMKTPLGATSGDNTGINTIRMRYADLLLMYAEAENEVNNGPTAEAKEALRLVRSRAFTAEAQAEKVSAYIDALNTKEKFFQAIMDERAWEFGGEGIRKYDLARWNKYSEVIYNLYYQLRNWANPDGSEQVPADIYYKETTVDGKTVILFAGIDDKAQDPMPSGYQSQDIARNWMSQDKDTGEDVYNSQLLYSFRGFIKGNANTGLPVNNVTPQTPLVYLAPYPEQVITDHRGHITQQYGY